VGIHVIISVGIHPATPDLDGGGPGAQAWWEAPCADRIQNR